MAEQTITIGGRDYEVACRDGEEASLHMAAGLLDAEAKNLQDQIGRQPEARTLLMAALMLADRMSALERRADAAEARVLDLTREVEAARERPDGDVPAALMESLEALAERSEALAERVEGKGAAD